MRFSVFSASAVLALASAVVGQEFFDSITSPTRDQVIPAGVPFDIIWVPEKVEGTIKITLLQGPTNTTLATGPVIATGVTNQDGKYSWKPTDNGEATYGFLIQSETNATLSQYSQPFHITGSGSSSSSVSGSSTTTIKLSTGPSYTSTTTSSVPSSTVTVVSTSTSANITTSASLASSTIVPSSNLTIVTSVTTASQKSGSTSTGTGTSSSSSTSATPNAAIAQVASAGVAVVGGIVLALAL